MKVFDETISGTFYISFAAILGGLMLSAFVSPVIKVIREDKVLMGYSFSIEYDLVNASSSISSIIPGLENSNSQKLQLGELPNNLRKRYMTASVFFFSLSQLFCLVILCTSITRIFFEESTRIRTTLRLLFLSTVISVLLWFAMTTVLVARQMPYDIESGYYDNDALVNGVTKSSICVGFYLSLTGLIICLISVFLVPFAAAH